MSVIPFPEPEPKGAPLFGIFDDILRSLIESLGDMTAREALEAIADRPLKDLLKELLP